RYNVTAC
nr:Chain B, acceptor peptide, ARG-TYR-ASN-VAL-THR-ALA-CYS [synthetic construct]